MASGEARPLVASDTSPHVPQHGGARSDRIFAPRDPSRYVANGEAMRRSSDLFGLRVVKGPDVIQRHLPGSRTSAKSETRAKSFCGLCGIVPLYKVSFDRARTGRCNPAAMAATAALKTFMVVAP
jgi:hypothetical protein